MSDENKGFHLEKSVSVGHLLTTITLIIAALAWTSTVDKKLAIHDTQILNLEESDRLQRMEAQNSRAEILRQYQDISQKLDRYIEKSHP